MHSRRWFLQIASAAALCAKGFAASEPAAEQQTRPERSSLNLPDKFPANPPDLIREIVTVAHFDLSRLKELLSPRPHLVKAAWDWGFGDWETPLGAACHMGRRDIAEYLVSLGATPSLFSAILSGDLSTVRETLERSPGLARICGPHSISLVAHARTAGKPAQEVLAYLEKRGDADLNKPVPLTDEDRAAICGEYPFGEGSAQLVKITDDMNSYLHTPMYTFAPQLNWAREGFMPRPLFHVGDRSFYPAGAPSVRVNFESKARVTAMKITDGEMILTATRSSR